MNMKKTKKSKLTLSILMGLTIISLVGVGFSYFVLDGSITEVSNSITAQIAENIDKTIIATIDDSKSDYSVRFDNIENGNGNITNGEENSEDLEFSVVFNVESTSSPLYESNKSNFQIDFIFNEYDSNGLNLSNLDTYKNLTVSESLSDLDPSKVGKEYIDISCLENISTFTLPTTDESLTSNDNSIEYDVSYKDFYNATITAKFKFNWGEAFDNKNPCYSTDKYIGRYLNDFTSKVEALNSLKLTIIPSYIESIGA